MKWNINLSRYITSLIVALSIQFFITPASFAADASNSVAIKDMAFSPKTITVSAGSTVTWTNNDTVPHTVTSKDKTLASANLSQGESYSYTFDKVGTYNYFCTIHPFMKGKVIVKPAVK